MKDTDFRWAIYPPREKDQPNPLIHVHSTLKLPIPPVSIVRKETSRGEALRMAGPGDDHLAAVSMTCKH